MADVQTNVLYYGDNLDILRQYLPHAAVDLVELDPPFNILRRYLPDAAVDLVYLAPTTKPHLAGP